MVEPARVRFGSILKEMLFQLEMGRKGSGALGVSKGAAHPARHCIRCWGHRGEQEGQSGALPKLALYRRTEEAVLNQGSSNNPFSSSTRK